MIFSVSFSYSIVEMQQSVIYRMHVNSYTISCLSCLKTKKHVPADAIFAQLADALEDGLVEDEELA